MSYAIAIGLIAGTVAIALAAFGALVWWLTTPGPLEEEEYQAFVDSLAVTRRHDGGQPIAVSLDSL